MDKQRTGQRIEANSDEHPWHALTTDEVLARLGVGDHGLDDMEAERRLKKHGPNMLPEPDKRPALLRFFSHFNNMLIYILLLAAFLTVILGEWVDTGVILSVVIINALIGYLQEGKAEKAMEAIRGMLSPRATVLRNGEEQEIPARDLVPGDMVVLKAGDRVPADMRIIQARNSQVEEASLTGESEPVFKQVEPVPGDAVLGDRKSMAYSSTLVTRGRLQGVVVATAENAEIGRISEMVSQVETLNTPLLRKLDDFGRTLSMAIVILAAVVFALGYFLRGFPAGEMFLVVVSLAVAAIPEGLPAILTITLALGVQRMARRNAIIRRLPAVETLGSVTVICSDKTGTLTRNEMVVAEVAMAGKLYRVSGIGCRPSGKFCLEGEIIPLEEHPLLLELARAGMLASDARLRLREGEWFVEGAPTEGSVVVLAHKAGMSRKEEMARYPKLDAIPFESSRRYMASLHRAPDGGSMVFLKGAPEVVLEMCSTQRTQEGEEPLDRQAWSRHEDDLAFRGHRVLAIASKNSHSAGRLAEEELGGLTLLGLIGIIDPPREEAVTAIEKCRKAGIEVKMITGDHLLTARSIAASLGIGADGRGGVSGQELELARGEELVRLVEENDIFARSSPEHKLRIVEALQSRGQVVAMTGDGVNDAPALKRADVGVAMGIKGTEATKEAADMILADDNFATIQHAVEEGRSIYDNLVKTILFILPTNGAQALIVITAVLFFFDVMPITPIQILWVNLVTAVTLALSLAFEPPEKGIMRRPPRLQQEPIISRHLVWRIGFVSALIASFSILLFNHHLQMGASLETARTVAVNTLVTGQIFYLFNSRFLENPSLSIRGLFGNRAVLVAVGTLIVLQLSFTYLGISHTLFGTADIPVEEWGLILAAGLPVFVLVELEKLVLRTWHQRSRRLARKTLPT
ncbi:MAG: cation-translocating P-type ATPase [Desulfovibrionales bacterium]